MYRFWSSRFDWHEWAWFSLYWWGAIVLFALSTYNEYLEYRDLKNIDSWPFLILIEIPSIVSPILAVCQQPPISSHLRLTSQPH